MIFSKLITPPPIIYERRILNAGAMFDMKWQIFGRKEQFKMIVRQQSFFFRDITVKVVALIFSYFICQQRIFFHVYHLAVIIFIPIRFISRDVVINNVLVFTYTVFLAWRITFFLANRVENQNEPKRPQSGGPLCSFWFSTRHRAMGGTE